MASTTDKELEQLLLEAGNRLENPPASVDELLSLLDQVEHCLSRVEQSPTKSMQSALAPSLKALVGDQLFRHSNVDVKVAVASCISEITRITAPDAPYDDDQMKDIFQLIVSSFADLADSSSRSYGKRTSILETVAKVRSCVVMLDLECDALIVEMFRHFLNAIRNYHSENVFMSMETIMILVLDESEDITPELLSPLLDSVKRGIEEDLPGSHKLGDKVLDSFASKEILPVARKLGEKVLESCASKVKPYLVHAMKSLGLSLADYSDVVATMCQDGSVTDDHNDVHAAVENKVNENNSVGGSGGLLDEATQADKETAAEVAFPNQRDLLDDKSHKPVVSNGVTQTGEDESLPDLTMAKKQEESKHAEQSESIDKSNDAEADNLGTEKVADGESKQQKSTKKRERNANSSEKSMKPCGSSNFDLEKLTKKLSGDENHGNDGPSLYEKQSLDVAVSSEQKETGDQVLSPKASAGDAITVASPNLSEGLPDESLSSKAGRLKENLIKYTAPSASKKEAEVTDSETKLQRRHGRNVPTGIADEAGKPTMTDASKEKSDTTSESEAKSLKQPSKKVDISGNGEGSSLKQSEDKKSHNRRKAISDKNVLKISSQDHDKEKISSLMSSTKASKDEQHSETSKTDAKRKQDSGKEKVSDVKESNEDLVGSKIKVWWPLDNRFYKGVIDSYDPNKKKHKVVYNDGDVERLILKKQRWEFVDSNSESDEEEAADAPSSDASPVMPLKKMKTDQSTRQEKMDPSPKSGGPSCSKSRSAGTKSRQKLKEVGEIDGKHRNYSKSIRKEEDDNDSKNQDCALKGGSKSTSSKASSKSKNDGVRSKTGKSVDDDHTAPKTSKSKQDTPKTGKSKQDTPNVTSYANEKTPKSGSKANANGTGKSNSGSSSFRETEGKESKSVSVKTQESKKRKIASSSNGLGSEGKNEKKRQRGA